MILFVACSSGKAGEGATTDTAVAAEVAVAPKVNIQRPAFSADTAYAFVEKLVSFGPRVPNTDAHHKSGDWLVKQLKDFGWTVTEQEAELKAFDGTELKARNIFAQINPEDSVRTLLIAHYDSRPWADQDPDPEKRNEPVLGANDGASGVGVILEIARQLSQQKSQAGIDILFVDAEDYGDPESSDDEDTYCLGSQYFAENIPYEENVNAHGILLDMVGSPGAQFAFETFSKQANAQLLATLWDNAEALGYGNFFIKQQGGAVTDDHIYLTQGGIPTIDIIDYRINGYMGFDPTWHTSHDDMKNISKETLKAVGETVMTVLK